jgi:hypothetical protein
MAINSRQTFALEPMNNNGLARFGLGLIILTAFGLAAVAAYESIVGLADLFAARKEVVILMAIFIEWAKLLIAGTVHMFWKTLPWWKWGGVALVAVHMAVTNIGIYSYLSSGYTLQEQPVAALEREIDTLNGAITSYSTIEQEAVGGLSAMDIAYQRLVEGTYVTRAERYEAENAAKRAELETERNTARKEIRLLEAKRAVLVEEQVKLAAKLGSIEHVASFVDAEDALKVVALFTLLLMLGLDPAAVWMAVLFSTLLSKRMRTTSYSFDSRLGDGEMSNNDDTAPMSEAAVEEAIRLDKIGYLKNRTKGK